MFLLLGLVALLLIIGAIVLAFTGFDSVQTGVQTRALQDTLSQIPPMSGSRRLYQDTAAGSSQRCGAAVYFELYAANVSLESAEQYYTLEFRRRGWVEAQNGFYPSASTRVDFLPISGGTTPPNNIAGIALPPAIINAVRTPDITAYALVITGWRGDLCPERNLGGQ